MFEDVDVGLAKDLSVCHSGGSGAERGYTSLVRMHIG
jgi:hypothetical protein